jgi:hypothetical protein
VSDRKRLIILVVSLAVMLVGLGCICGTCSNPLAQRESDNASIVQGAVLGNAVMAKGIGSNNAPISETSTFNSSEDIIYCVVKATSIDKGTTLFARWVYQGEPFEDTPVITADQKYTNTYVEFHIEPKSIGVLKSGNYECRIYVNGNPVRTATFKVQ